MSFTWFTWDVRLNKGDAHPVCVKLNNGVIWLNLQVKQAAILVSLLTDPSRSGGSIESRGGEWFTVSWDIRRHQSDPDKIIIRKSPSSSGSHASLPEDSAETLACKISRMIGAVNLSELSKTESGHLPSDPLASARLRMDKNLRSVFGV